MERKETEIHKFLEEMRNQRETNFHHILDSHKQEDKQNPTCQSMSMQWEPPSGPSGDLRVSHGQGTRSSSRVAVTRLRKGR